MRHRSRPILGWCVPSALKSGHCRRSRRIGCCCGRAHLGFSEVDRFEEFGAEQWFGVRRLTPSRCPVSPNGIPLL
jgi:hypothetical protein